MTDDEYNAIGLKMVELFEDELADPEVQPKIFKYQAMLARWVLKTESSSTEVVETKESDVKSE